MNLETHRWNCPRPSCKKFYMSYTEKGLQLLSEEHMDQHRREDREMQNQAVTALEYVGPRKDYDILNLTAKDIGFLKTRGIAIDKNIEWDLSIEPKPTTEELSQNKWAHILDRALRGMI